MTRTFKFLEDVALADCAFEATGDSLSELFEAAAWAVVEAMVDPTTVQPRWQKSIDRQSTSLPDLLFEWVSDLVYLKDLEGVVFHGVTATVDRLESQEVWALHGTLTGEPVDMARHDLRGDVKAVTKHLYELRQEGTRWRARIVLDM